MDCPVFLHVIVDILLFGEPVLSSTRFEDKLPWAHHFVTLYV